MLSTGKLNRFGSFPDSSLHVLAVCFWLAAACTPGQSETSFDSGIGTDDVLPAAPDDDHDVAWETRDGAVLSVDLVRWIDDYTQGLPGPGSDAYARPSAWELEQFAYAVEALRQGDVERAAAAADVINYRLVVLHDSMNRNESLHGLVPAPENDDGRGLYIVRPTDRVQRRLVIEAPHPRFDLGSDTIGAEIFRRTGARALAVAGTHRCANTSLSSSPGETRVCNRGGWGPYRTSDMAHTKRSFFQFFHEIMTTDTGTTVAVQIHGFRVRPGLPEFTVSDGTKTNIADVDHISNRFSRHLEGQVISAGSQRSANSCNRPGNINLLCGSANAQSIYSTALDSKHPRFLHIELSQALRTYEGRLHPGLVIAAILDTFPVC